RWDRWSLSCSLSLGHDAAGLPAALGHTGDLALERHHAELVAGDPEYTDVALGSAGDLAPVVQAHAAAVNGELLQLLPLAGGLQRGTLGSLLLHHPGALALTGFHGFLGHSLLVVGRSVPYCFLSLSAKGMPSSR